MSMRFVKIWSAPGIILVGFHQGLSERHSGGCPGRGGCSILGWWSYGRLREFRGKFACLCKGRFWKLLVCDAREVRLGEFWMGGRKDGQLTGDRTDRFILVRHTASTVG